MDVRQAIVHFYNGIPDSEIKAETELAVDIEPFYVESNEYSICAWINDELEKEYQVVIASDDYEILNLEEVIDDLKAIEA